MGKIACITFNYLHKNTELSAKSIGADIYKVTKEHGSKATAIFRSIWLSIKLKKYETYLIDAAWALFIPLIKRLIFRNKIMVIYRLNNPFFNDTWFLKNKNPFEKFIIKILRKQVDGIIAVSSVTANDAKIHRKPYVIAYSMLENLDEFLKIKPNLNTNNFLTMGYAPYKAFDITLSVFHEIRKHKPDSKLIFLGKYSNNDIKKYYKNLDMTNVVICGYVKDVKKYLEGASYFIEFPHYEPGPTSVLESMAAGLICFSNENLGHKDFIKKVSKDLIIKSKDPKKIANEIIKIVGNNKKKKIISKKSKEIAKLFRKEYRLRMFRKAFFNILSKLEPH
ncbi:MAG: glycosyltransferase [Candidatus Aenigmatarchaeota archaeon]